MMLSFKSLKVVGSLTNKHKDGRTKGNIQLNLF